MGIVSDMLFYHILCNILIIPLAIGTNSTLKQSSVSPTISYKKPHTLQEFDNNKTTIPVISEGGTIFQKPNISLTLPKENHVDLLALDEEISKGKSNNLSVSKVVPRKGVPSFTNDHDSVDQIRTNFTMTLGHHQEKDVKNSSIPISVQNTTLLPTVSAKSDLNLYNNTVKSYQSLKKLNNTPPKKPLILSYETLSSLKEDIPAMPPSSTITRDQVPSPRKNGPIVQVQSSANRYPGLVTPLIISILLVPMFAVLGYMALRRGQEAWKNRHYKRMDFLLDGMYND